MSWLKNFGNLLKTQRANTIFRDEKVMRWQKNLLCFAENNTVGKCPYCSSQNTAFGYRKITAEGYGYGAIFCKDCRKGYFLDRADLRQIKNMGENIPEDISFTD